MIHRIQVGKFVIYVDDKGFEQFNKAIDGAVKEGWADPREDNNKKF